MIDIADRPEVQAQIEEAARAEQQAQEAPQFVRAPVGNGHEAALKQGGAR